MEGRDKTYDRIGAGICCPFIECVDAVVSRGVLLDEQLTDRLRMHPLAEPCGGNCMERDVYWMHVLRSLTAENSQIRTADRIYDRNISGR